MITLSIQRSVLAVVAVSLCGVQTTVAEPFSWRPSKTATASITAQRINSAKASKGAFVGDWTVSFVQTSSNCTGLLNPEAFNGSIGISSKLVGVDYVDGSPFFRGRVSGTRITFRRAADVETATHEQTLVVIARNGRRARVILNVDTITDEGTCSFVYSGSAFKE